MALVRHTPYANFGAAEPARDEAALEKLKAAGLLEPPVNVYAVAEYLGLDVIEEAMDEELSGFIEPRKSGWLVGVNAYHHPNRQRFTIAHEIGHFLLHKPHSKHIDVTFARRAGTQDRDERDADQFAADLLMPEKLVRESIAGGLTSLEALAQKFKVSVMAAKFRVRSLGYAVR